MSDRDLTFKKMADHVIRLQEELQRRSDGEEEEDIPNFFPSSDLAVENEDLNLVENLRGQLEAQKASAHDYPRLQREHDALSTIHERTLKENQHLKSELKATNPTGLANVTQSFLHGNHQHFHNLTINYNTDQPAQQQHTQLALRQLEQSVKNELLKEEPVKKPRYSDACIREARDGHCHRSCEYWHTWQEQKWGRLREVLPANAGKNVYEPKRKQLM